MQPLWKTVWQFLKTLNVLGTRQEWPLSTFLFTVVLETLVNEMKKGIKSIQTWKKEIKVSLFSDDIIIYVENPRELTKNKQTKNTLLELISSYSKVAGYKVNIQKYKSLLFSHTPAMGQVEFEIIYIIIPPKKK